MFKWLAFINVIVLLGLILFLNVYYERKKQDDQSFPCEYILNARCSIKATWENCPGGLPYNYCERKFNGFL